MSSASSLENVSLWRSCRELDLADCCRVGRLRVNDGQDPGFRAFVLRALGIRVGFKVQGTLNPKPLVLRALGLRALGFRV